MNKIKVDLGSELESINLYPLGDFHYGSSHHEHKLFKKLIAEIANDEIGYVVLNGDLLNNAITTSVSDTYTEAVMPEQALDDMVEALLPIKEKILSCTMGNHEGRTYKSTGIDLTRNLMQRLGIPERYSPVANILFLSFGKSRGRENVRNTVSLYHTHGAGGGRTIGGKVNKVERLGDIIVADIYVHSHTHTPFVFKESKYIANNANKGVSLITSLYVNTNAFEGYGGYGEMFSLRPSAMENVKVTITADKKGNKIIKGEL